MLAVSAENIRTIALVAIGLIVVAMLISVKLAMNATKRIITVVIALALAGAIWSQRSNLDGCISEVRDASDADVASCTFFGFEFEVDVPA
jgi:uncharacterized membrane protein YqjE